MWPHSPRQAERVPRLESQRVQAPHQVARTSIKYFLPNRVSGMGAFHDPWGEHAVVAGLCRHTEGDNFIGVVVEFGEQ